MKKILFLIPLFFTYLNAWTTNPYFIGGTTSHYYTNIWIYTGETNNNNCSTASTNARNAWYQENTDVKTIQASFTWSSSQCAVKISEITRLTCAQDSPFEPSTGQCLPPPPTCPPGTHNISEDVEVLECRCDSGYDTFDLSGNWTGCEEIQCPVTSPINSYPLVLQNVDSATCYKLYNGVLGFSTEFQQIDGVVSCCWSDAVVPDESPCPPNFMEDSNGVCKEIPTFDHDCPTGTYFSIVEKECVTWGSDNNTSGTSKDDQSGTNDGLNSDGTMRDSNSSWSYNGGGSELLDENDSLVKLEFNDDEVNDMLEDFKKEVKEKFDTFIRDNATDLFTLYEISIPISPDCACVNPTYSFSIRGKSYVGEIDTFCPNATSLMEFTKPVLWFVFLITTLLMYFRGQ